MPTKLEKLRKEYRNTFFEIMICDGSAEMEQALHNKLHKLEEQIKQEQIKSARKKKYD